MSVTSRRALAMPAIVAIPGFTATGPSADADESLAVHHRHDGPHGLVVRNAGPLVDLQPATGGPFDGASAAVRMTATRSVVIHAEATDPGTGTAGPRLACLPVVW